MGRPRKYENKMDDIIKFRVTKTEKSILERLSEEKEISKSAVIRLALWDYDSRFGDYKEHVEAIKDAFGNEIWRKKGTL